MFPVGNLAVQAELLTRKRSSRPLRARSRDTRWPRAGVRAGQELGPGPASRNDEAGMKAKGDKGTFEVPVMLDFICLLGCAMLVKSETTASAFPWVSSPLAHSADFGLASLHNHTTSSLRMRTMAKWKKR
ncbi:hypothetical protein VULLAG_LOCUS16181 [Vulpes lagopus]